MTKIFHDLLEKSKGNVVNIGSDVSVKADPQYFGYSDCKAAVLHMTKMMALEYAPNIRINCSNISRFRQQTFRKCER